MTKYTTAELKRLTAKLKRRAERDRAAERLEKRDALAAYYALDLRVNCGCTPEEAAILVVERYPHTAAVLAQLIHGEKRDQFGALVGHNPKGAGA